MKTILIDQKGATLIEFALILPVLILLLFGIIEFGIIMFDKAMLTSAVREGARSGVVYRWPPPRLEKPEIEDVVLNYCKKHLISFAASSESPYVSFPDEDGTGSDYISPPCEQGRYIAVKADYEYNFIFFPGGVSLNSQAAMRCE